MEWIDRFIEYPAARLLPIVGGILFISLILHGIFASCTSRDRYVDQRRSWLAKVIYLVFLALTVTLALTSFGSIYREGKMEHQALLYHITAAGAFTVVMVAFAIWWNPLWGRIQAIAKDFEDDSLQGWWLARYSLWLILISTLGVAASMLFGMLPWFDTEQLKLAVTLHRYFGIALIVGLILHLYSVVIQLLHWR